MGKIFPEWLTKQMIKGARGFNLDAYVMALEGWRRGLTLTWYLNSTKVTSLKLIGFNPLGKSFSLYSEESDKTHHFYRSRGDKVSNQAVDIVQNKYLAKEYFQAANISTPKGIKFNYHSKYDDILNKIDFLEFPLVIKPTTGSLGKEVVTNITDFDQLREKVNNAQLSDTYDEFIIEEHFEGEEYRVYVVGNKVVAATKRVPANVYGDGVSTISELVDKKNKLRKDNPYLATKPILIDNVVIDYLEKQDLSLTSIPATNQVVYLKGQSNISAGGDPVDFTDELDQEVVSLAVNAVKSIPGLNHAGVDIIFNGNSAKVIEINATADIAMHLFPVKGKPRNVPEKIIDYYFPKTKGFAKGKSSMYFDYREVNSMLRRQQAQEVKLMDAPKDELIKTRFIVSGTVQGVGYRKWIRQRAVSNGIHGYVRNLKNGSVVVIAASDNKETLSHFKKICRKGSPRAKVEQIKELDWNGS
ncbi:MAG TPA: acylphosphatase, partial [Pseudogracilibacillus sp.]|nr:acylphosphatase [Pseudogracilibacillus sp.]